MNKPSQEEILAYMEDSAERNVDRFDTPIGEHEWINFDTHPDEDTDVQLIYNADHGSLYIGMELSDAKAVHQAFGRAIAESEAHLRFFPKDEDNE